MVEARYSIAASSALAREPQEDLMGLFDNVGGALKGALGQLEAGAIPSIISDVLAKTDLESLNGIVAQLQQGGLNAQVSSWLGNGTNLPVTAEQLRAALGNEQVRELATHFGLPVDGVLKLLAEHLPATVDQASPNGALPAAA
jgi:uncharacterized protein YidB (DUF937 family)